MRHLVGCLQEQQTLLRSIWEYSAAFCLFDNVLVIVLRLKPEQREPEPTLAHISLGVAGTGVAVHFREDRNDIVRKIELPSTAGSFRFGRTDRQDRKRGREQGETRQSHGGVNRASEYANQQDLAQKPIQLM